jgi:hypothetical protein
MNESTPDFNTEIGTLPAALAPARSRTSLGESAGSPTAQALPMRDEYVDWVAIGQGPDGLAYLARRQRDGVAVELRVVRPMVANNELRNALQRRIRLTSLCTTALVRRVIDSRLSDALPIIVLERPLASDRGEVTLQAAIEKNQTFDRISVARELIAVLRATHRLGLYLGNLHSSSVILGSDGHIRVDVTAVQCVQDQATSSDQWPFAEACDRSEQDDLGDLKRVLDRLFESDNADLSSLPARSRAALRSMLRTRLTTSRQFPR